MNINRIPTTEGYVGFFGFLGFFQDDIYLKILCSTLFLYFLFFLIAPQLKEIHDERMVTNYRKSQTLALRLVAATLALFSFGMFFEVLPLSRLTLLIALMLVCSLIPITIVTAFLIFERKS